MKSTWPQWSLNRVYFISAAVLASVVALLPAGCGTVSGTGSTATSRPANVQQGQSNQSPGGGATQGTTKGASGNTATSMKNGTNLSTSTSAGSQKVPSGTLPSSGGHATSAALPQLQLENIQIGDKSVLFNTTHGNMRVAFADPHIENGNPNRFVVTLVNMVPGKYAVNKTTRLQTHWASSMTLVQDGQNLIAKFDLLPSIVRFTSAIGAGQMALYTFQ